MKRWSTLLLSSVLVLILMFPFHVFAAGESYNTNQSAEYLRMMSRNASIETDAVFYNPAGIMHLKDGFHLSYSNQFILQNKKVVDTSSFNLPTSVFPALNKDGYTGDVNVWFYPNLYAVYKNGPIAGFLGFLPIGGGGTLGFNRGIPLMHKLVYSQFEPQLKNNTVLSVNSIDGSFVGTSAFLRTTLGGAYALNDKISFAFGGHYIYAFGGIDGSLDIRYTASDSSIKVRNYEVDVDQSGQAFGFIAGINLTPIAHLNIGFRYEYFATLQVINNTNRDDTGLYPNQSKGNDTIPSMMGIGLTYRILPQFIASISFDYWFQTWTNWGGLENKFGNRFDLGIGFEYQVIEPLKLSIGFLYNQTGRPKELRDEIDFNLNYWGIGSGLTYSIFPELDATLAFAPLFYFSGTNGNETQSYTQSSYDIAISLAYRFET